LWAAGLSPNRRLLATGSFGEVILWDIATLREIARFNTGAEVTSLAFSGDGKTVAAGTFDGLIQLWNIASRQQAATLRGHISFIASLAFSPDGRTLASSSMEGTLRLWTAPGWEEIARAAPPLR
jgi:WD40 repeat protein